MYLHVTTNTNITARTYNGFPYVSDRYLTNETDALRKPVSVGLQEIEKIKVKLLSARENNYNL